MRSLVVMVALAACRTPAPVAPAPPAEAEMIERSHAVFAAMDKGDAAALGGMLDARYVHFESSFTDREAELKNVAQAAKDAASQVAGRTWSDEHVFARGTDAIFVGKASERQAGNDSHGGGYTFEGWYTLGWSRASGAWKLAYLSWRATGAASQTAIWNQIFEHATGFEHAPNRLLAQYASTHAPGTAMDVAMGQGRNAIFLAKAGWTVTGVDISDEGIRQAREAATAAHVPLDAVIADVTTFDYGTDRYDLVAMIYAYPALSKIADLQRATKSGGLFVYEFFAPDGPDDTETPAPGALAAQFAGWEIVRDEIVDDVPDWRQDRAKIQRFVARKR